MENLVEALQCPDCGLICIEYQGYYHCNCEDGVTFPVKVIINNLTKEIVRWL